MSKHTFRQRREINASLSAISLEEQSVLVTSFFQDQLALPVYTLTSLGLELEVSVMFRVGDNHSGVGLDLGLGIVFEVRLGV